MRRPIKTISGFKRFCPGTSVLFMMLVAAVNYIQAEYNERLIVNRFGQRGVSQTYSAHTFGAGAAMFGLYGNGTLDQNFLKEHAQYRRFDSTFVSDTPNPKISTFNFCPFIGIGLADFIDASVMLPVNLDFVSHYQEFATGDLQITFKLGTHASYHMPVFDMGFLTALTIPTGSKQTGVFPRHTYYYNKDSLAISDTAITGSFYSSENVDIEPHMMVTLDLGALRRPVPLALLLDFGVHVATKLTSDKAVLMSAALQYHPARACALILGFNAEMRLYNFTHGFAMNQDPFHMSPEIVITPSNGLVLTFGSDISLSSSSRSFTYLKRRSADQQENFTTGIEPKWRFFGQVGWNGVFTDRDRDRDGIPDKYDQCPDKTEDVDGIQDDDGCPDYDNDNDGIPDSLDKCSKDAEDKDGFRDNDGCPDYDNDNDHTVDTADKCPTVSEDIDGFQDQDGCPDYDNDKDMVPDTLDRCPDVPEDLDGFQDNDGCPDVNNDLDGVPDSLDRCPNQAGAFDNNGCPKLEQKSKPRTKEIKRGRVILRGVTFEKGTATLEPSSFAILDDVYASLAEWPLVQLEIQGHTDNQGAAENKFELSRNRAEAVRNYLINKGVSPTRITAVGKADSDPIGKNATKAGRTINNRIELRRIDP